MGLTWNREPFGDTPWGFDNDAAFFNSMLDEELEFFQWDPDWDIVPIYKCLGDSVKYALRLHR